MLQPQRVLMTKAALDAVRAKRGQREDRANACQASVRAVSATGRTGDGHRRHDQRPNSLLAPHQIILRPLVTEKGMHRSTRYNAYAFEVNRWPPRTTCAGPSRNCSTSRCCACTRRTARASRAARGFRSGHTKDWKKAIVKLHPENRIDFF